VIPHHRSAFPQRNTAACQNADVRTPNVFRSTGVVILLALTFVLAVLTPVAIWARGQVLDTDRYLSTVAPLASDKAIQKDVAARATDAILKELRRRGLTGGQAIGGTIGQQIDGSARQAIQGATLRVVESPVFRTLWVSANRQAHAELVRVLTGSAPDSVVVRHGRITLDLTSVVDQVRTRLRTAGVALVDALPPIRLVIDVANASGLEQAQQGVKVLKTLAWALPVATIVLLALAILLAADRRRTALRGFFGIVISMLVLRFAIAIGDIAAARNVPSSVAGDTAVHHYYSHLTSLLDRGVLIVGAVAAVGVLVVALLTPAPRPWAAVLLAAAGVLALASWTWIALAVVAVALVGSWAIGRRGDVVPTEAA